MGLIITFWVLVSVAGVLALQGIVIGSVRLKFGKTFTGWDFLLAFALFLVMPLGFIAGALTEAPGFYVREVGAPAPLTVDHLTYFNGPFGSTSRVRVDTSAGVYFLFATAPVPDHGTVYRISRVRPWGSATWVFLCPSLPPVHCWPTTNL